MFPVPFETVFDVRQELLGLGSANLLAELGGGYPAFLGSRPSPRQ
jgi:MFS superfamily sulfate permease-like transporter